MKRTTIGLAAWIALAWVGGEVVAENPKFPQGDARRSMGNLRPRQSNQGSHTQSRNHGHLHHRYSPGYSYYPGYGVPYGQYVPYGYTSPPYVTPLYGYTYPGYVRPYRYYYPRYGGPVVVAPRVGFAPQVVNPLFGLDGRLASRPNVNINVAVAPRRNEQPDPPPAADEGRVARGANQQAVALAWRFIGFGDAHFANQKYREANSRYRKAVTASAALADGYFRQGLALMAMGNYDLAAKAIRRGLTMDPQWPRSNFRLDEIYGENQLAKSAHVDTMAKAAGEKPNDADLHFLLGVHLYFDGKQDLGAAPFFEQAQRLAAGDDAHIRAFLPGG